MGQRESVDVELIRHDSTPDDTCPTYNDKQTISLPGDTTNVELYNPFCLEKNQRYQVKLTFTQYNPNEPKGAQILIDSVSFQSYLRSTNIMIFFICVDGIATRLG